MKLSTFLCVALTLVVAGSATAQNIESSSQGEVDIAVAPIVSRDQLEQHLAANPESPISYLPPEARSHFLASLVFTSKGLGSYSYGGLASLSVTDAYKILSLFGAQSTLSSVPGLRYETALDEALDMRLLRDALDRSGLLAPMADPRMNTICEVYPDHGSACRSDYGHHCTEGCG